MSGQGSTPAPCPCPAGTESPRRARPCTSQPTNHRFRACAPPVAGVYSSAVPCAPLQATTTKRVACPAPLHDHRPRQHQRQQLPQVHALRIPPLHSSRHFGCELWASPCGRVPARANRRGGVVARVLVDAVCSIPARQIAGHRQRALQRDQPSDGRRIVPALTRRVSPPPPSAAVPSCDPGTGRTPDSEVGAGVQGMGFRERGSR